MAPGKYDILERRRRKNYLVRKMFRNISTGSAAECCTKKWQFNSWPGCEVQLSIRLKLFKYVIKIHDGGENISE